MNISKLAVEISLARSLNVFPPPPSLLPTTLGAHYILGLDQSSAS